MKYEVYNVKHRENVRWYARPVDDDEVVNPPYLFQGNYARLRACEKAVELNEKEGRTALVA